VRKTLKSLVSVYKDLVVYVIYYSFIIGGFALVGAKTLTFDPAYFDPATDYRFDAYMANYSDLSMMIFQTYVLGTYDNYPDNQILAVQNYEGNYVYFIMFIFLNMFLFVEIPASIFYQQFRETRSKYIVMDELKQQHSLILAFVTLAQEEKNLSFDALVNFLFALYKQRPQYLHCITHICLHLDHNHNQTIVTLPPPSRSTSSCSSPKSCSTTQSCTHRPTTTCRRGPPFAASSTPTLISSRWSSTGSSTPWSSS
jgi:hypothetical protein